MPLLVIGLALGCLALRVAVLADLHLDPAFVGTGTGTSLCRRPSTEQPAPLSRAGCDSSRRLVELTLDALEDVGPIDAIFYLGDLGPHQVGSVKALQQAFDEARELLERSEVPIFPVLGNNDVHPNYHVKERDDPLVRAYADVFRSRMGDAAYHSFCQYGYYAVDLGEFRVVALNTVHYSPRAPSRPEDSDQQLEWLNETLRTAEIEGRKVIILTHTPFGINAHDGTITTRDTPTLRFRALVRRYRRTLSLILHGHYHAAYPASIAIGTRVLVPVLVCPSIAPSNDNDPGFYILELDSPDAPDYLHYALDLAEANAALRAGELPQYALIYRFSQRYAPWLGRECPLTSTCIERLYQLTPARPSLWSQLAAAATGLRCDRRRPFLCSAVSETPEQYATCIGHEPQHVPPSARS
ncbi:Acid sphingomyelinase [Giardia muris]|uniref:Acid sphingomyelinase n=1 Tax=Giardia muris TaxID=5742 RepID=A0A4Z1T521_GIAMU|nr:Acid sphingomyelinase [Giardia muris]|eukprot:TNJ27619.1 Acid sphingomyelinase [Giardia muris]